MRKKLLHRHLVVPKAHHLVQLFQLFVLRLNLQLLQLRVCRGRDYAVILFQHMIVCLHSINPQFDVHLLRSDPGDRRQYVLERLKIVVAVLRDLLVLLVYLLVQLLEHGARLFYDCSANRVLPKIKLLKQLLD